MFALQSILINTALAGAQQLSVAEIKKLGGRQGKLSPTHQNFTPEDNASFVDAMRTWNAHKWSDAIAKFQEHLNRFPNSPWAGEAELHLGCYSRYNHNLTRAKRHFKDIIAKHPDKEIAEKALERLAGVYALQLNLSASKDSFKQLFKRTKDWRRTTYARAWIGKLERQMAIRKAASICGPKSLAYCLKASGLESAASDVAKTEVDPDKPLSLYDLAKLSGKKGLPGWPVEAELSDLPKLTLPVIAHLRSGHFSVIAAVQTSQRRDSSGTESRGGQFPNSLGHLTATAHHSITPILPEGPFAINGEITLIDPYDGKLTYSLSDFSEMWTGTLLIFEHPKAIAINKLAFTVPIFFPTFYTFLLPSATESPTVVQEPEPTHIVLLSPEEAKQITGGCCGLPVPVGGLGPCNDGAPVEWPESGCPSCSGGGGGGGGNGDGGRPRLPSPPDGRPSSGWHVRSAGTPTHGINLINLNVLIEDTPIFYEPALGPPIYITLTYNQLGTDSEAFGNKWSFYFGPFYSELPNNDIMITQGGGRQDVHQYLGGNAYQAPPGIDDTVTKDQNGNVILEQKHAYTYTFDGTTQNLISVADRWGNTVTVGYNANGNISTITDAVGRATTFTTDANGRVTQVTIPDNRSATFGYDGDGNLIEIADMAGYSSTFAYDGDVNVLTVAKPQGTTTFSYTGDREGDPENLYTVTVTDALGNQTIYQWDGKDQNIVTRPDGSMLSCTPDENDRAAAVRYYGDDPGIANLPAYTYEYDSENNITSITDALYNVTQRTFDANNNLTSETDPLGNTTTYTYDSNDNLTSVTDPLGRVTQYDYDANDNLIQITDALGSTITYTYNAQGETTSKTDKLGNTTTYSYDANGNLLSVTDSLGNVTTYAYDSIDRRIAMTDARNNTTSFTFDDLDRVIVRTNPDLTTRHWQYDCCGLEKITDENGNETTYTRDALGRVTTVKDALLNETTYTYNSVGDRISEQDALGRMTSFQYDREGRLGIITYADGGTQEFQRDGANNLMWKKELNGTYTTYTYDANGRITQKTENGQPEGEGAGGPGDPGGGPGGEGGAATELTTSYTYDAVGNLLTVTDPMGGVTTNSYDNLNRLVSVTDAVANVTTCGYDANGNITSVTDANNHTTTCAYDDLGRMISVSDPLGETTTYAYNEVGSRTSVTDPLGNTTTYTYDNRDRLVTGTDPLGQTTTQTYDAVGNKLTITDVNGNTTSYTYDVLNRKISVTNALSNTTTHSYDAVGNLATVTDANNNTTTYAYDSRNRLISETYADGGVNSYTYDMAGNRITSTDQNGTTVSYTYDGFNRPSQKNITPGINVAGTTQQTFSYDDLSRMTHATDNNDPADPSDDSTVTFQYDAISRLIQETQNGKMISYQHDAVGNKTQVTYPGGKIVTMAHDSANRLDVVSSGMVNLADYAYDGRGLVSGTSFGNGVVMSNTIDSLGRITSHVYTRDAATIAGFEYGFDAVGNKKYEKKLHDFSNSERYLYHNIYRLVDFKRGELDANNEIPNPNYTQVWNLDPVGNWNSITTNGAPETRTFNVVNEYTDIGGTPQLHDDNGNLFDDGTHIYEYDFGNRLVAVIDKATNNTIVNCKYDALNRRIAKVFPDGSETRFYLAGGRVVEERDETDAVQATYVYGNYVDEPVVMDRGGSTYYYHANTLYSVAAMTDSGGTVVERYQYDAYGGVSITDGNGNPLQSSAIGNRYMFTGRRLDSETGLYYYRNRMYSSERGRFLQRDPVGYVDGINLYEYVKSCPLNLVDPSGLEGEECKKQSGKKCDCKNTGGKKTEPLGAPFWTPWTELIRKTAPLGLDPNQDENLNLAIKLLKDAIKCGLKKLLKRALKMLEATTVGKTKVWWVMLKKEQKQKMQNYVCKKGKWVKEGGPYLKVLAVKVSPWIRLEEHGEPVYEHAPKHTVDNFVNEIINEWNNRDDP